MTDNDVIYIPERVFVECWGEEPCEVVDGYVPVDLFSKKTRKLIRTRPDIFFHTRDLLFRQCCLHSLIKTRFLHKCGWCYDTIRIRKIAAWPWAPPREAYNHP